MQIPRSERGTDRELGGGEDRERGRKGTRGTGQGETERAVATNKHRQKERREMGASTEERSECKHEREDMRDGEREVKQGGVCVCVCVCAGYSWQRDSQSQLPV